MIDEILQRFNLKYDDLTAAERETIESWAAAFNQNQLTVEHIKAYIASMRDSVEQELTQVGHNNKQDIFLKARLRNYLLLEAFLDTPAKAQKALDRMLAGIKPR